jgi:hypothetical protein
MSETVVGCHMVIGETKRWRNGGTFSNTDYLSGTSHGEASKKEKRS